MPKREIFAGQEMLVFGNYRRNVKSAMAESKAIKEAAANGPPRPTESPQSAKARLELKIKTTQPTTLEIVMKGITIHITANKGASIESVCDSAKELSEFIKQPVSFEFNGVSLCTENKSIKEMLALYLTQR